MKRINSKLKTFWGTSELGFSFMATMETSFFIVFLTDIAKLPLGMIAVITGLSGIADAVSAVIAGAVIDKVNLKGGKYRPWLVICPPIVVIFFMLMFTKIGSDLSAAIICGIGYVISHFVWNIAWTANRAMIGVLSDDASERGFLSGRIAAGASGGKILASWLVRPLAAAFIAAFITLGPVWGYTLTAAVASLSFLVCYLVHYFITKGYDTPEDNAVTSGKKSVSLIDMFKVIGTNPQLLLLLLGDAIRLVGFYMVAAAAAFYAKIVLGEPGAVSMLLIMFNAGALVGSLFSGRFAKKLGSKKATIIGTGGMAVVFLILYFIPVNKYVAYLMLFVAQVVFGVAYGLTSSMYAMNGTYSEYKTGKDVKGTIMACSSLAIKIAVAVRGVVLTGALAAINYSADAAITPEAQSGIKLVFLLIPAAFSLVSALLFMLYKIKDSEIEGMEKEIALRKAGS